MFSQPAAAGKHSTAACPWLNSMSMSGRQNAPCCSSIAWMQAFAQTSRSEAPVRAVTLLPIGSRRSLGRLPDSICTACSGTVMPYGSFTSSLPDTVAKSFGTTGSQRLFIQSRQSRTRNRAVWNSLYLLHHMVASWPGVGTSVSRIGSCAVPDSEANIVAAQPVTDITIATVQRQDAVAEVAEAWIQICEELVGDKRVHRRLLDHDAVLVRREPEDLACPNFATVDHDYATAAASASASSSVVALRTAKSWRTSSNSMCTPPL